MACSLSCVCDADAGLMLGYLNYDPTAKEFGENYSTLTYTVQGGIDTMPDVPGIGLYDGSKYGVYIGGGNVVFSSAIPDYVTKETVARGTWSSWCTYEVCKLCYTFDIIMLSRTDVRFCLY